MAEQPWRNPRRAPQRDEIPQRLPLKTNLPPFVRAWWPALLWACIIFSLSTDSFSAAHTVSILYPFFHWLLPSLLLDQFEPIHYFTRKSAHFAEYFIFCMLLFRGVRAGRAGWRWTWALAALSIAAGYACLDEIHQAFVASRTASAWDSLLDSVGAFVASAVMWLWLRTRNPSLPHTTEVPQTEA